MGMTPLSSLLWMLAVVFVLLGVAGTVLPVLPGPILVFIGLLLAAWADGFVKVGVWTIVVLGFLVAATIAVETLASSFGTKKIGASKLAVAGAFLGSLAGFFFGFAGLVLGPFLGAVLGEYIAQRDVRRAGRIGFGAWLGMIAGMIVKVTLVFMMIGIFLTSYLFF